MSKAAELIPDIHHKMNKKIAQLTKAEVDAMATNHQNEIQEILRDAAEKINKFKESIDVRQNQVNQEAMLEKLQRKYEAEKQTALHEFQSFKQKTKEKQDVLERDYQDKFGSLRTEVEGMNSRFKEKIAAFESANKNLRTSLDEAKRSSSSGLADLKKKHDAEMEEHVRSSNEKYQNLLVENLRNQEELRDEMARAVESAKKETRDAVKAESEKLIGQLRAQLSGDKQESLMLLRREWEEKLQTQKDDLSGKLEKALSELKAKDEEVRNVRKEKDAAIEKYQAHLRDVQRTLDEQNKTLGMQVKSLEDTLEQYKAEMAKLKQQCVGGEEEIARQEQLLSDKNSKIHELELTILRCKDEAAGLTLELQDAKMSGAATNTDMQGRVVGLERELSVLRNELAQNKASLTAALNEIAALKTAAQKAAALAEKAADAAAKEKEKMQKQLDEALNAARNSGDRASEELASQRKLLADREETFRREMGQKDALMKKSLDDLQAQHRVELDARSGDRKSFEEQCRQRERDLQRDLDAQKTALMDKMAAAEQEHRRVEDELTARHKEEVDRLKQAATQLTAQLHEMTNKADGDKSSLRSEMTRLETRSRELQSDLDRTMRENERVESVCTGLKAQVESLRDELKASQKALRDKMEASLAKSDAEWASKLEELKSKHEEDLRLAAMAKEAALAAQFDELSNRHKNELNALRAAMDSDSSNYSDTIRNLELSRSRVEGELKDAISLQKNSVKDLEEKHVRAMQEAEERRKRDLEALREELSSMMRQREGDARAANEAALEAQRAVAEKKLRESLAKAATDQDAALSMAAKNKDGALVELERKLQGEKAVALAAQEASNKQQMAEFRNDRDKKVAMLNQDLDGLRKALGLSEKAVKDGQVLLSVEREERAKREEAYLLGRDQLLREHEQNLRKEKERHDVAIKDTVDRSSAEIRGLRHEFKEARSKWEENVQNLENEISRQEKRYRDRESRPEDLARIRELGEAVGEKELLLQKAREEMLYFKRELVNREDNYNKKFNAAPNVGVMQVLKPKDADTGGKGRPPRNSLGSSSTGGLGIGKIGSNSR